MIANVCLGLLPFAAVNVAVILQEKQVYGYPATRGALRATRAEIERAAVRLLPEGLDRRRGWTGRVGARDPRRGRQPRLTCGTRRGRDR